MYQFHLCRTSFLRLLRFFDIKFPFFVSLFVPFHNQFNVNVCVRVSFLVCTRITNKKFMDKTFSQFQRNNVKRDGVEGMAEKEEKILCSV